MTMCAKCQQCKLVNSTPNGSLYYNEESRLVLVEFKNLCFDFYEEEYLSFVQYVCGLDAEAIERKYKQSIHKRKIPLPVGHVCLTVLLNKEELSELKFLFTGSPEPFLLKIPSRQIDYKIIYN